MADKEYDEYATYAAEIEAPEESEPSKNDEKETDNGEPITQTEEVDQRSIHVSNVGLYLYYHHSQVDYETTPQQLQDLFSPCGELNRITIAVNKNTGQRKGFAYVEFAESSSVDESLKLNGTSLNGREIKVTPKRTNIFGFNRGRGGRGGARGGFNGRGGASAMLGNAQMMYSIMQTAVKMAQRGGRGGHRGGRGSSRGGSGHRALDQSKPY